MEDDGGAGGTAETSRRAFAEMADRLAFHLIAYGMERTGARELAEALLDAMEGGADHAAGAVQPRAVRVGERGPGRLRRD